MRRLLLLFTALFVAAPMLLARDEPKSPDKPGTPQEQLKALNEEFQKAAKDFKSREEALAAAEKFAARALDIAEKNAKDPVALDALLWIVQHGGIFDGKVGDKTVEMLIRDHVQSDRLLPVCQAMEIDDSPLADKLLRAIMEKNPKPDLKGQACYSLAIYLNTRADANDSVDAAKKQRQEAEKLLEQVSEKYADVKLRNTTLGAAAKAQLNKIKAEAKFAVGNTAPDIAGPDLDGKDFKLSDYRGKVVLLDFWGHW